MEGKIKAKVTGKSRMSSFHVPTCHQSSTPTTVVKW
ncbi:hypothetical protein COLO4_26279 [Corchorus olitorius]|nr:hypothetical protein COLO4_26279 [Corchorus olitorius]